MSKTFLDIGFIKDRRRHTTIGSYRIRVQACRDNVPKQSRNPWVRIQGRRARFVLKGLAEDKGV